jgi:outer membrane protein assembly factor BamB
VDALGRVVWSREFGAGVRGTPLGVWDRETVRVVVALRDGRVPCLDLRSGATLWERQLPAGFEYASPMERNGQVVVGDTAGNLTFLSLRDGATSLTIPLHSPIYAPPANAGEWLVVGDTAGILRAIDLATGLTVRRADLGGPIQAAPVVAGNRLIVGSRAGAYHLLPLP